MPPKKPQSSSTVNHHHHSSPAGARKATNPGRSIWHWTNERHMHFLNSMEASFVESMFGGGNGGAPPLDRYLPDSAESTQDLAKERRTSQHTANASSSSGSSGRKTDKNTRIHSRQKSSQDQVVPQYRNKRDDEDDAVPLGTSP